MTLVIARHANAFKLAGKTLAGKPSGRCRRNGVPVSQRSKRRFDPLPGRPLRPNELTRNRGWHASVTHRPPPASPDRLII